MKKIRINASFKHKDNEGQTIVTQYNPSISEAPRTQNTPAVRQKTEETMLAWIERTGRLIPSEIDDAGNRLQPPDSLMEQHARLSE